MIRGVAFSLCAAVAWMLANASIRRASRQVGSVRASLWGVLSGAVIAALLAPLLDEGGSLAGLGEVWPALAFAGAAAVLGYGTLFFAFEHGALSTVAPLTALWPLVSVALATLLLGDPLSRPHLAGGGLITLGAVVVGGSQRGAAAGGERRRAVTLAALVAALGFGLLIPALARVGAAVGAFAATALVYGAALLLGFPLARVAGHSVAPPPRAVVLSVVATGALEALGFACIALAHKSAPAAVVSPLVGLSSAFTVLYGWLLLGERVGKGALAGAALVCVGSGLLVG